MIVFEHEFVNRKETDKPAVNNIVRKFRRFFDFSQIFSFNFF